MHPTPALQQRDAVELCKLFPVSFFGEMALLDPWEGKHPGTVVAETYSEVLVISKKQVDVKAYGTDFFMDVRRRAVGYPSARAVRQRAQQERRWRAYKDDVTTFMKKKPAAAAGK